MSTSELQQEIQELKEKLAFDEFHIGQKAEGLRIQADRIERHFADSRELIKMKEDQFKREAAKEEQESLHNKAIED
jgi:hypothetical protein